MKLDISRCLLLVGDLIGLVAPINSERRQPLAGKKDIISKKKKNTHLVIHNRNVDELADIRILEELIARLPSVPVLNLREDIDEFAEHAEFRPVD